MGLNIKKYSLNKNKIVLATLLLTTVLTITVLTEPAVALVQDGVELSDSEIALIRSETNATRKWARVQNLVNVVGVENYKAVLRASEFEQKAALVWEDDLGIKVTTVQNSFNADGTPTTLWNSRVEYPEASGGGTTTSSIGKDPEDVGECSLIFPTNIGACIYEGLAWIVNILIELFGLVLTFCAWVFRVAIKISIIDFKNLVDNAGTRAAWQALRDISNMFFIFILLYAAVGTILQIHKVDAKKIVTNVVIIAVLINFSFLISTLVIDAGNQLALFFYDRITTNGTEPIDVSLVKALKLSEATNLTGKDLSNDVTLNSEADFEAAKPTGATIKSVIIKGIGAIIIILITAFLLAAAAYMFLARAVILALLTVVSPLAFLLMAFPQVGSAAGVGSKWWSKLINQSLFAPVYLILIYAVVVIIRGGGAQLDHGGDIGTALYFFIVAYMLYWCFAIAIDMGAEGANAAKGLFSKGKSMAVGMAVGAGAMASRNTIGRGAQRLSETSAFKATTSALGPTFGRYLKGGVKGVAGASFGGKAGGYVAARDAREKAQKEFAEEHAQVTPYVEQRYRREAERQARGNIQGTMTAAATAGNRQRQNENLQQYQDRLVREAGNNAVTQVKVAGAVRSRGLGTRMAPPKAQTAVGRAWQRIKGVSPATVVAGAAINSAARKSQTALANYEAEMRRRVARFQAAMAGTGGATRADADREYDAAVTSANNMSDDIKAELEINHNNSQTQGTPSTRVAINGGLAMMHAQVGAQGQAPTV